MMLALIRILSVVLIGSLPVMAQQPLTEGKARPVNEMVSFSSESSSSLVHWAKELTEPGSAFLRVVIQDIKSDGKVNFKILGRDRAGRLVFSYDSEVFTRRTKIITPVIFGSYVRIEVVGPHRPVGLSFEIASLIHQKSGLSRFSTVGSDEREPIVYYRRVAELLLPARAVSKLMFVRSGFPVSCTGFLLSKNLLLTNQHCISVEDECSSAVAVFGYQANEAGSVEPGDQFSCDEIVRTNRDLDFSLLRLSGDPGNTWGYLKLSEKDGVVDEQAYLIQHPNGEPKQISRLGCLLSTLPADGRRKESDVGHVCDTAEGSSGSPLLGKDFRVVGLHHFGFEGTGKWSNENRAVRSKLILESIKDLIGQ